MPEKHREILQRACRNFNRVSHNLQVIPAQQAPKPYEPVPVASGTQGWPLDRGKYGVKEHTRPGLIVGWPRLTKEMTS
jgi:hypothetical protein